MCRFCMIQNETFHDRCLNCRLQLKEYTFYLRIIFACRLFIFPVRSDNEKGKTRTITPLRFIRIWVEIEVEIKGSIEAISKEKHNQ